MCPKPTNVGSELNTKSHIEEFSEKIPLLYQALTEYPDPQDRWISYTYPIDLDTTLFAPKKEIKLMMRTISFSLLFLLVLH